MLLHEIQKVFRYGLDVHGAGSNGDELTNLGIQLVDNGSEGGNVSGIFGTPFTITGNRSSAKENGFQISDEVNIKPGQVMEISGLGITITGTRLSGIVYQS